MLCKGLLPILLSVLFSLVSLFPALYSSIVINEVCYDPAGADDFHEWIELYNNGTADVNMEDWLLYSGGSQFTLTYVFPAFLLRPHHYLLLAEEDCADAHLFTNLILQNGGSETDGIRLVSPDSSYTDTILYDSPNTNLLPDDIHETGTVLCLDVSEGHTLARRCDGVDTNSAADWFDCTLPTPGSANAIPIDLGFGVPVVKVNDLVIEIHTPIHNLSTEDVYNLHENLQIYLDNSLYAELPIPGISPQDSVTLDITIHCSKPYAHEVRLFMNVNHDVNIVDNLWITSIFLGEIPLVLNEILYAPSPDNQEWIEIHNRGNADISLLSLHLQDAAGNHQPFDLDIPAQGYRVLCTDSLDFVHKYPDCPSQAIVKLSHWVTLNNDEETVFLKDDAGVTIDSLHYVGSSQAYDRSLERRNPQSAHSSWDICTLTEGGTPGRKNSNYLESGEMSIESVQFRVVDASLRHIVRICSEESSIRSHLTCLQYDDGMTSGTEIGNWDVELPEDSVFIVNQSIPDAGYHAFQYTIDSEQDNQSSEYWSFYNRDFIPFAINEIMYDPLTGYPEWLEIRRNVELPAYPVLTVHISVDSVQWQAGEDSFTILVEDEEDAETLCSQFQLENATIIQGLPTLNNTGEAISISDDFGNVWDAFTYEPDWSPDKGISIERIQPLLFPGQDNWSPCISQAGGTPGAENSIHTEQVPNSANVGIEPNPFFPRKGVVCSIHYTFPRAVSRINCRIYDLKGRKVRTLADQSLVSAEGSFLWDGRNDSGKMLPTGVYLLYWQAYDRDLKHEYHKQNTIVLGR